MSGERAGIVTANTSSIVTYCAKQMITTSSPMIEQFIDTTIVASTDKETNENEEKQQ